MRIFTRHFLPTIGPISELSMSSRYCGARTDATDPLIISVVPATLISNRLESGKTPTSSPITSSASDSSILAISVRARARPIACKSSEASRSASTIRIVARRSSKATKKSRSPPTSRGPNDSTARSNSSSLSAPVRSMEGVTGSIPVAPTNNNCQRIVRGVPARGPALRRTGHAAGPGSASSVRSAPPTAHAIHKYAAGRTGASTQPSDSRRNCQRGGIRQRGRAAERAGRYLVGEPLPQHQLLQVVRHAGDRHRDGREVGAGRAFLAGHRLPETVRTDSWRRILEGVWLHHRTNCLRGICVTRAQHAAIGAQSGTHHARRQFLLGAIRRWQSRPGEPLPGAAAHRHAGY